MSAEAFAAQLRAARLRKFCPADGIEVAYELPSQFRAARLVDALRSGDGDAAVDLIAPMLRSWSGITQSTLLGDGVGSSEPAPLTPDVVRIVLGDRPGWATDLCIAAVKEAADAAARQQGAAKN